MASADAVEQFAEGDSPAFRVLLVPEFHASAALLAYLLGGLVDPGVADSGGGQDDPTRPTKPRFTSD